MRKLNIPFYGNTKDDSHCAQACFKMVLKHFLPRKSFSYKLLDRVTLHKKGLWVGVSGGLIFFAEQGLRIVNIELFDYRTFANKGQDYLRKLWSSDFFSIQSEKMDFRNEQSLAKRMIRTKSITHKNRPPTMIDVDNLFGEGYVIVANINPFMLDGVNDYAGHSVVITGVSKKSITFHDPGLPPAPNLTVSQNLFQRAFLHPDRRYARLYAVTN